MRGHLARNETQKQKASIVIQSTMRGHLARNETQKQKASIVIQSTMRGHLAHNELQKQKASVIDLQCTASNMQRFCFKWGIRLLYITTAWIITYYLQYHDLLNTHTSISSLTHLSNSLLPSVMAATLLLIICIANDILPACWSNNPPQIKLSSPNNPTPAPIVEKQAVPVNNPAASQKGDPPSPMVP